MKKAVLGILVLVCLLGAASLALKFWPVSQAFPYNQSSADVQVQLKESNFAAGQRSIFLITAGAIEGEAILTPVPTAKEGGELVESQIFGVKSAFQERPAPYAGQITARIACDAQKYVKEQAIPFAGRETKLILAVASGRRIYGSCSAEEIKYASVFWAGFDEQRSQAVTVKLFKPVANPEEVNSSQQELLRVLREVTSQPGA